MESQNYVTYTGGTWKSWDSKVGLLLLLNLMFSSFLENELVLLPYHPILPHHSRAPPFHPSPSEARLDFLRKQLPLHFQPIWPRRCYCLHFRDSHTSLILPISVVPPGNNSSIVIITTTTIRHI